MTTYIIGPGQTYETFTALEAAVVLAGDDIVDGGLNSYTDTWTPASSGTSGHLIELKNATIVADGDRCIYSLNRSFLNVHDIIGSSAAVVVFYFRGATSYTASDLTAYGTQGMYLRDIDNFTLDGYTVSAGVDGLYNQETTTISSDMSLSNVTMFDLSGYGMFFSGVVGGYADGLTLSAISFNNVVNPLYFTYTRDITGSNISTTNGGAIQLTNVTTGVFTNVSNSNCAGVGFAVDSSSGITVNTLNLATTVSNAVYLLDSTNVTINGGTVVAAGTDAVHLSGTTSGCILTKLIVKNSRATDSAHADAFTSHVGCSDNTFKFNLTYNNRNTSHAHTGDAAGAIYHNTSINDGDIAINTRAAFSVTSTGVMVCRNNLTYNNESYPIAATITGNAVDADYNAYISNLAAPFMFDTAAGKTFTEWISYVGGETNSWFIHEIGDGTWKWYKGGDPTTLVQTTTYCPVTAAGKLVDKTDNLLIDGGVRVAGVNDGTETDLAGHKMYGLPPIGVYEVVPGAQLRNGYGVSRWGR